MTLHPHLRGWVIVLDIETTGLVHDAWAEPLELGAVLIHPDGVEVAAFSSLIRPRVGLPPEAEGALQVNGIQPTWLNRAPRDFAVMGAFEDWKNAWELPRPVITSFNRAFDLHFYLRMGGVESAWSQACIQASMGQLFTEVKEWKLKEGGAPGPSLKTSAEHFEIPQPAAHRALVDARTAADVLRGLRRVCQ